MSKITNNKKRLSLCLAVFNEEKNIHYPLNSASDIADEVIVVDGGSSDKTLFILKKYGEKVKIIHSDNPRMFHLNKQKAIEAAQGDWILQLDADEALSDELKEEIIEVINNPKGKIAFWLPRKNWFLTRFLRKGGQYPDYTLRLYKNGFARFPCRDVHENVEILVDKDSYQAKVGYLKNPILHYADPDFSRYLLRWDRYTSLEVDRLINQGFKRLSFLKYFFWFPIKTFFLIYFRHLGFFDGFPGLVFALFSSLRFWVIYIKFYQKIS